MRNYAELILKIACAVLGCALLFHLFLAIIHGNPLAKVTIPAVPTLASSTNATADVKGTNTPAKGLVQNGTNSPSKNVASVTTNVPSATNTATNSSAIVHAPQNTNGVPVVAAETPMTNSSLLSAVETNPIAGTNTIVESAPVKPETNANVVAAPSAESLHLGTNKMVQSASLPSGTNLTASMTAPGTNGAPHVSAVNSSGPRPRPEIAAMMGMPGMPGMGGKKLPDLAPAIKARVDRIYESELFGQVIRPMPAALMGIAGNMAILRSSTGQTGLVKEGDSLGGMKLVRIGVNRVLVEENGTEKELMIFNGYGGESLLSKKETPDETKPK